MVTRDKDFGILVFLNKSLTTGVILLKTTPMTVKEVHEEIYPLLEEHSEAELSGLFCVVEPRRHRIRHLR